MSSFTLQWPAALWLLLLVLPLAGLLAFARKRRRAVIDAMGGGHSTHRPSRDSLRVAAFALLILALTRPGYAPQMLADTRARRDVVFALDVSRSMLAQDVPPSRLEVARLAIRDALRTFTNERVGLVAYAGSASILCPLTEDYDFVRYMLEQATPLTVDFGGTTLQAAVEKAADQVFLEGRGDVQDLVILTDGGDHDSQVAKVAELLDTQRIDALILGLGDPDRASPIPVENEDDTVTLLESGGQTVYTQLDDEGLNAFTSLTPRARYIAAGTTPFNLGRIYREYAANKPVQPATEGETGLIIYREAAWWLIFPALALLCLSERLGARGLRLALLTAICAPFLPSESHAETSVFEKRFEAVLGQMQAESYEEAAQTLAELYQRNSGQSPAILAVLRFNQGLCLTQLSRSSDELDPRDALAFAHQAQQAFLAAKRHDPAMNRAGRHVQAITAHIAELRTRIEAQEEAAEQPKQPPSEESSEWDDRIEEDYDEADASGESESSSQATGDFAAGSEMQALPTPNDSAQDILEQEAGNLQFRQQKRSSTNQGKVEKDY